MIAVVRIKGSMDISPDAKRTLEMLRLNAVNHCALLPEGPTSEGMLRKGKNYLTWGPIDPKVLEKLLLKRGRLTGDKRLDEKAAKELAGKIIKEKSLKGLPIKPVFRLNPPRKGLRSVRLDFPKGDLGPRAEKINELLERMI